MTKSPQHHGFVIKLALFLPRLMAIHPNITQESKSVLGFLRVMLCWKQPRRTCHSIKALANVVIFIIFPFPYFLLKSLPLHYKSFSFFFFHLTLFLIFLNTFHAKLHISSFHVWPKLEEFFIFLCMYWKEEKKTTFLHGFTSNFLLGWLVS